MFKLDIIGRQDVLFKNRILKLGIIGKQSVLFKNRILKLGIIGRLGEAKTVEKAEHTRKYVSILRQF